MPSSTVDLPDPFSPTKNVTLGWKAMLARSRTAAMLYGYESWSTSASGRIVACSRYGLARLDMSSKDGPVPKDTRMATRTQ